MQIPIFVINLNESTERLDNMHSQLSALNLSYERFPAVRGDLLSLEYFQKNYPQLEESYHSRQRLGQIGNRLSHISISKIILQRGYDKACVLEDDVVLDDDFGLFMKYDFSIPYRFDVLKLECIANKKSMVAVEVFKFNERSIVYSIKGGIIGSGAYIINKQGACKVVEKVSKIGFVPTDEAIFKHSISGMFVVHAVPYPARQHGESIIAQIQRPEAKSKKKKRKRSRNKIMNSIMALRLGHKLLGFKAFKLRVYKMQTKPVRRW